MSRPCPCGGASYAECCGPLHDGAKAVTAEALMRSRYSAFVRGLPNYLYRTWHPRNRPETVRMLGGEWQGLEVVATELGGADDETGVVEFRARYLEQGVLRELHETSEFARRAGRWFYVGPR